MTFNKTDRLDDARTRRLDGMRGRKKVCVFCGNRNGTIGYKDVNKLGRYVSERGKIFSRRITGSRARHQRVLTAAIKHVRYITLMPYACD